MRPKKEGSVYGPYHAALGGFVRSFAQVEYAMHLALCWYAKTDEDTSRAVFSGVRAMEASGYFRA